MDKLLFEKILETTPKFNERLVQGLAVSEMQHVEKYVHERIFKVAAKDLPPSIQYLGYERCTPEEEHTEVVKRQRMAAKKATFEIAPSDFYMCKYLFSFEGQPIEPLYIYLPYVRQAGIIRIRGSLFHITPVIADRSLSVGMDSIYMPFNRLKVNMFRFLYNYLLDGKRESEYLVRSKLHNAQVKSRGRRRSLLSNMKTILPHYLFARYGLRETFQMYCGATVEVGYADTVNVKTHPPEEWVICESINKDQKPIGPRARPGTAIRMAVRKQEGEDGKPIKHETSVCVAAFFYIADHFPNRVQPGWVDDARLWVVLLGHLLFGSQHSEGKLAEEVYSHLQSLDKAMDQESQNNLMMSDIMCSTMYDFLANMSFTFSNRVTKAIKTVASLYGKRLMVLRYVLSDLRDAVNNFMFKMNKDSISRKRPMTRKDVEMELRRYIKPDVLFKISGSKHREVVSVSCPGDNMLFKLTTQALLQTQSSGTHSSTGTGGRTGTDASKLLDVSVADIGSYNTMSKSEPSGRNKLNPYCHFDADGVLIKNPELTELLDRTQEMIQR